MVHTSRSTFDDEKKKEKVIALTEEILALKIDCNVRMLKSTHLSPELLSAFFTSLQLAMINNVIDLKWVPRILVYNAHDEAPNACPGPGQVLSAILPRVSTGRSREAKRHCITGP